MNSTIDPSARFWSTSDILKMVPQNWRKAEVMIGTSIGSAQPVGRISLHRNKTGKQVVLIHKEELEV